MPKKIQTGSGGNKLRANQAAAGIPDSKPFTAPENERTEAGVDRILKCHINGQLVSSLNLEPQVLAALDYYGTDEGMAERQAHPMAREASGIALGAEPWNKALEERRDDVKERGMDTFEARDPLKEVADAHAVPGMKPKFLSERRIRENGSTGEYQVVKDAKGDTVKVRGMVLGHIPVERAESRNKFYREKGKRLLKEIGEQYQREGGATAVADQ